MMRVRSPRCAWSALLSFAALGCGSTSAPVLERIVPMKPPEFTHRVDVFLVTNAAACVIGEPCTSADASRCFSVGTTSDKTSFDPPSVEFVPPGDARLNGAAHSACFELDLAASDRDAAAGSFSDLRDNVYQLSAGAIDLDVRVHELTADPGGFKLFEGGTGIFLQPDALESSGLPLMSPDSDFVFALTGETNDVTGSLPTIKPCAGTNWLTQGGLGGAAYTWVSTSCLTLSELRWHFLYQAYFAMRDVTGDEDLYTMSGYPSCGQGVADSKRWFPRPSDCAVDPDATSCGHASCDDAAFAGHVLSAHWPDEPGLVGNHCLNGRTDYDETAPDAGGVCDALGR
jgi:hypothetical protein